MLEIELPEAIKVGGFDYGIEVSEESDRDLDSRHNWGEHSQFFKRVRLHSKASPQQFSLNFIHELIFHAVDHIYCADQLEESQVTPLAYGVHQVLEQLGIRFVRRK